MYIATIYMFHTAEGLISFFVAWGQILNLLQLSARNRTNVVPQVKDWHITQFDYNKDISVDRLPKVINWTSKGILKVEYLGTIFQIYSKKIPFDGECLRCEGHYSTKEKKIKLEEMVTKIAVDDENRHPFTTVEYVLLKHNEEKDLS